MEKEFKHVFFHPWVGEKYKLGFDNKKILVLGESHICGGCKDQCGDLDINDEGCRKMTTVAVQHFLNYKKGEDDFANWMNTYTRFSNIVHNKQLSGTEMVDFWDSIAFYNYVQFATDEARVSPSLQEFAESEKAFFEVLDILQPDLVIAWGDRLWNHMPSSGSYKESVNSKVNWGKGLYYYKFADREIPIMTIYHPSSSSFNYEWHEIIQEGLSNATYK